MATLITRAETAQDIAAGLNKFLNPVPEHSAEIAALISECFAISSVLRELSSATGDPRYAWNLNLISQDLGVTLTSLKERVNRNDFDDLQYRIEELLAVQDNRLVDSVNEMSLGNTAAARVRSFERRRPQLLSPPSPPSPPPNPARFPRQRFGPQSPLSPGFDQDFPWNPPVPEVPNSPITTNTSSTSQSSRASVAVTHWAPKVFDQSRPTTVFRNIGQLSTCLGEDSPSASSRLAEDYEKLLEIPFERGDLLVRFYLRPSDQRARIHCKTVRPSRSRKQSCLPLTSLRIQRVASCLRLCRMDRSGQAVALWANLRFPNYEQLILFHCTFLALKAEDEENHIRGTVDDELHGEKEYFGGLIIDDNYEHALRVFRDRDSGGIRMQASVRSGDLKRTPVWTAFITHHIASRTWMRKDPHSPKTVYLADLQRYIFTDEYSPQLGPDGEHELRFKTSHYALEFMDAIKELAQPPA